MEQPEGILHAGCSTELTIRKPSTTLIPFDALTLLCYYLIKDICLIEKDTIGQHMPRAI